MKLPHISVSVFQKHGYIRIDGRTPSEQRDVFANRFQTDDSIKVAILSITAANAGLHLTAASLVVFGELFWNPGVQYCLNSKLLLRVLLYLYYLFWDICDTG